MKGKKVIKVVFKDSIQVTGSVVNDLSVQRHKAEMQIYPQGIHIKHGGREIVVPYGNIKQFELADAEDGE